MSRPISVYFESTMRLRTAFKRTNFPSIKQYFKKQKYSTHCNKSRYIAFISATFYREQRIRFIN